MKDHLTYIYQQVMKTLNFPRSSTIYKLGKVNTFRNGSAMILGAVGENVQNKDKFVRVTYTSDGWNHTDIKECGQLIDYLTEGDISIFSPEQLARIKILVQVDQAGAEALIVAYLCKAGKFRDLFLYGIKPHVFVALHVFSEQWKEKAPHLTETIELALRSEIKNLPLLPKWKELDKLIKSSDDWAAHERYYYIAKMICHASNYGMKGQTFALNVLQKSEGAIRLSVAESTKYLEAYHKLFPEIRQWHSEIQNMLNENKRVLRNLFGEPREFGGFWGDTLFREAYAFIPQSTVGEITNKAKLAMYEHIEEDDIIDTDQLQNGHDSALAQTLIGQERFIIETYQNYFNLQMTNFRGEKFNMKSEAQIGLNWAPMKVRKDGTVINPLGMREFKV